MRGDLTGSGLGLVVVGVGNVGKEKGCGEDAGGSIDPPALIAGIGVDLALSLDIGDPGLSLLGVENGCDLAASLTVFGLEFGAIWGLGVAFTAAIALGCLTTIGEGGGVGKTGLEVWRIIGLGAIGGDGAGTDATASTGATSTISSGSSGGAGTRHH